VKSRVAVPLGVTVAGIDAGANVGLITLRAWKKVGSTGIVYSFEPHPLTYKRLLRNLKLNEYCTSYAKQLGVSDAKQGLRFTNLFISDLNSVDPEGSISITVDRLDSLVSNARKIKLLKIDVEGFELFALKGAELLLPHTEYVLVELAPRSFEKNGYTTKDIIKFLEGAKYEVYAIERGGARRKIDPAFAPKDKYQDILAVKRS
jgi:FkbM family methyltransferase